MLNMVSKGKCQHCGIADVNHVTDIGVADEYSDNDNQEGGVPAAVDCLGMRGSALLSQLPGQGIR